jgi:hypothetical protein
LKYCFEQKGKKTTGDVNGNENGDVVGVDKRLGVDEGSQMQVVLGIVKYSLMGSDDGLRRVPFKDKHTDRTIENIA